MDDDKHCRGEQSETYSPHLGHGVDCGMPSDQVYLRLRYSALCQVRTSSAPSILLLISLLLSLFFLCYGSAYEALVQTLCEIFKKEVGLEEFLMCWNRRIAQSELFFDFMSKKGFVMTIVDSGVYSFIKPKESRIEADNAHSDSLAL